MDDEYTLSWQTTRPITVQDLEAAYGVVSSVLAEAGLAGVEMTNAFGRDGDAQRVYIKIEHLSSSGVFGFPSAHYIGQLTPREMRAMESSGRDGWLGLNGMGAGIVVTDRQWIDFPFRLLLSVLSRNAGLQVTDAQAQTFIPGRFTLPADPMSFDWMRDWPIALKQAVEKHWFVDGQIVRFEESITSPYAW